MSAPDLVVRGERVLVDGALRPAAVHVSGGHIAAVTDANDTGGAREVVEAGDRLLFPGLVDAHVHVNEPGRTEWEGYATATAAAIAGGVTTIVDMPLNGLPPLLDEPALRTRLAAIAGTARADVAFWGGVVSADASHLPALAAGGVAGIKVFLSPSGVDEFANVGEAELEGVMPVLRELGLPLLAHAESPAALARAAAAVPAGADPRAHATWLASRPAAAEVEAIDLLVRLARRHGTAVHVVHVSSREGCERIAAARAEGLLVSGESCPHYLTFAADEIPDGATAFKCAPPLRDATHREALWAALADGTLGMVATDHSPSPPALKALDTGDFLRAWGGIAGLELLLAATWTGASIREFGPEALGTWLAEAPARLAGLEARKGRIAPGLDADLLLWDPDATFEVRPEALHHRHPITPWAGRKLRGVARQVWLRGRLVYHRDRGFTETPGGEYLPIRRATRAPASHS